MSAVLSFLVRFALLLAFGSAANATTLVPVSGHCSSHAVVLVGGFGDDWRHFQAWLPQLEKSGVCVLGFPETIAPPP